MLFKHPSLGELVKQIRAFGEFLMPYNYPQRSPQDEEDIVCLKIREVTIDGYSLVLFYSKSDYDKHYLEVVQVTGKYIPFLPFSLVCKVGRKFLGDKELSYVDFLKEDKKIYCWTVFRDKKNNAIPVPYVKEDVADHFYEGLNYKSLKAHNVLKFY